MTAAVTVTMTPGALGEARFALICRIRDLRADVSVRAGWTAIAPHPAFDPVRNLEMLHQVALWLRVAEHAYRALGGTIDDYLPATARTPRPPR